MLMRDPFRFHPDWRMPPSPFRYGREYARAERRGKQFSESERRLDQSPTATHCLASTPLETEVQSAPTVLRENGCGIGFYSSESDEPAHVHVVKAGCEAKFWHGPVQRSWNKGFREAELRGIDLIKAWNETE